MIKRLLCLSGILALLVSGCATNDRPEPIIDVDASMEFLEEGLRPEVLLFPDYLMLEDFQLNQHGRIPETQWIGAGLSSQLSLSNVRSRLMDVLDSKGWKLQRTEIEKQSFRLIADRKQAHLEIRGVQGIGPTEMFMLYWPDPMELAPFNGGHE